MTRSPSPPPSIDFRVLFESAPGAYLVLTADFVIVAINEAYLNTTMTKREEILGRHMFDVLPDYLQASHLAKSLETVLRTGNADTMAVQKYTTPRSEAAGGWEERYWRCVNSPVFDANHEVAYIIHRVEDVTELMRLQQKRSQQRRENRALRSRTEKMELEINVRRELNNFGSFTAESILSSINDQFLVLDQQWRYIYVNEQVVEVTGLSREELLGRSIWELFPTTVGSLFYTQVHRAVAEQAVIQFEYFYALEQRWFENRVYPLASGVSILVTEITDRKRLLQELATERARFEAVLQQMPAGVMIADAASGNLVLTNEQAKQIIGYDYELSLPLSEYDKSVPFQGFNSDGQPLQPQEYPLMRSLQTGESVTNQEIELRWSDGRRTFINANSAPIFDSQGQIVAAVVVFVDTTHRKEAEQEREQLLALEQAAREEAEAANRVRDEFLAVLSHELRSPLNPILGWIKLLQTKKLDQRNTDQALSVIERNAKLQAQLINDLLDVSQILQGKLSLSIDSVDLISAIRAATETVRLAAEAKSIQINTNLEASASKIIGDPNRLQQIIWNLLSNAVKFTDVGGQVDIRLEHLGSQLQITVSDTGRGIDPRFLPYVFDYFRQADAGTTRKFGGLGLGLAIVRHLVELHGGTIQAASQGIGQGATFTVRFPLTLAKLPRQQHEQISEPVWDLRGVNILVVDDDPDIREFTAFLLEQSGANVTAAASGGEALIAFTQSPPDLLLSDIGMPNMDGYQLIKQVRNLPPEKGGKIPAIALTTYAGEIDQQQVLKAGFQKHISKPVDPDQLIAAITELVRN